jgi:hypothetical protein
VCVCVCVCVCASVSGYHLAAPLADSCVQIQRCHMSVIYRCVAAAALRATAV